MRIKAAADLNAPVRCRYVTEAGTAGCLCVYWSVGRVIAIGGGRVELEDDRSACPNSYGTGQPGTYHNAYRELGQHPAIEAWDHWAEPAYYAAEEWPTACTFCGAPVPAVGEPVVGGIGYDLTRQVNTRRLYAHNGGPLGDLEVGDLFYLPCNRGDGGCPWWDNCPGQHLNAVLPHGATWDIDSRASNCTLKGDRLHRCWIKAGRAEDGTLTVNKAAQPPETTCAAGAGSIQSGAWHGYLDAFVIATVPGARVP